MLTSMQTADIEISGLASGSAARGVRSALKCIHGVAQVSMALNEHYVTVTYDAFRVSPSQFETAVSVMGCEVERLIIRTGDGSSAHKVPVAEVSIVPISDPN